MFYTTNAHLFNSFFVDYPTVVITAFFERIFFPFFEKNFPKSSLGFPQKKEKTITQMNNTINNTNS